MNREVSDKHCLQLIQKGGRKRKEGVSILFRSYAVELRRFFAYKCGNLDEADDLVQETFVKVVRFIDSYNQSSSLQAWIWTVARNCLTDHFRRKGAHLTVNLDGDGWKALEQTSPQMQTNDPPPAGENVEDCVRKQFTIFGKANPDAAYALTLRMDGYDIRFIAGVLNRSEGATREFLSQCRKKIEDYLSPCRDYLAA